MPLFAKFAVHYKGKWTNGGSNLDEIMLKEWAHELRTLTQAQFEKAASEFGEHHPEFPPTVFQFKNIAVGKVKNEHGLNYVPECYRVTRKDRLLEEGTRTVTKEEALAKLRAMRKSCGANYEQG
jgi:hypothetical protein